MQPSVSMLHSFFSSIPLPLIPPFSVTSSSFNSFFFTIPRSHMHTLQQHSPHGTSIKVSECSCMHRVRQGLDGGVHANRCVCASALLDWALRTHVGTRVYACMWLYLCAWIHYVCVSVQKKNERVSKWGCEHAFTLSLRQRGCLYVWCAYVHVQ